MKYKTAMFASSGVLFAKSNNGFLPLSDGNVLVCFMLVRNVEMYALLVPESVLFLLTMLNGEQKGPVYEITGLF